MGIAEIMKAVKSELIDPSQSVVVLPNLERPRLYFLNGHARERWNYSAFYPAYRWNTRVHRLMLRCKALLGLVDALKIPDNIGTLRAFLQVCLPTFTCGVVFVGTPGPTQKFTVQLWNDFQVIGYLKYGEKPAALDRLHQEYVIFSSSPEDLGPRVLLFGEFSEGLALVLAPVPGRLSIIFKLLGILVQSLQYESTAYYYVLCSTSSNGVSYFLHLDVTGDYRRNGRVFLAAEEVMVSRRRFKGFWIPAFDMEFVYYLIKKIAKSWLNELQTNSLVSLYQNNPRGCKQYIHRFWSDNAARKLISAVESIEWSTVCTRISWFRKVLLAKALQEDPAGFFAYWKNDSVRRIKRLCVSTWFNVVFFGADGSGKSSVLREVEASLGAAFRKTLRLHLRPSLLVTRKKSKTVTSPHGLANYSPIMSLLTLGFFSLDLYHWVFRKDISYACSIDDGYVRSILP